MRTTTRPTCGPRAHHALGWLLAAALLLALAPALPAQARGGGGFAIRPGFVPDYSGIDVASPPVTLALGGRGVVYAGRLLRLGGEGYADWRAGVYTGGGTIELAIPLPGPGEIDLGGGVGGGSFGLYTEPAISLQLAGDVFAFEARLSYMWHPLRLPDDVLYLHRGMTYVTLSFLFGDW